MKRCRKKSAAAGRIFRLRAEKEKHPNQARKLDP